MISIDHPTLPPRLPLAGWIRPPGALNHTSCILRCSRAVSMLSRESHYLNQLSLAIDGLDATRFAQAWDSTVARHDVLRTRSLGGAEPAVASGAPQRPSPVRVSTGAAQRPGHGGRRSGPRRARGRFRPWSGAFAAGVAGTPGRTALPIDFEQSSLVLDGWSSSRLIAEVLSTTAQHHPRSGRALHRLRAVAQQRTRAAPDLLA